VIELIIAIICLIKYTGELIYACRIDSGDFTHVTEEIYIRMHAYVDRYDVSRQLCPWNLFGENGQKRIHVYGTRLLLSKYIHTPADIKALNVYHNIVCIYSFIDPISNILRTASYRHRPMKIISSYRSFLN